MQRSICIVKLLYITVVGAAVAAAELYNSYIGYFFGRIVMSTSDVPLD